MIIKSMALGPIMANCFIIGCSQTKEAVVVDPGDEVDRILLSLAESGLTVKHIINTHGHFDHVGANHGLKKATGAAIAIHPQDAPMLGHVEESARHFGLALKNSPPADITLADGDVLTFGELSLQVIHTPAHTVGGISLATGGYVLVGDTLFANSIGRTDFPGGDYNTLIASIKHKLFGLGDDTRVLPGHGPETTIGAEKRYNPFLR